jgi:antibiotic biosynthesis monooxygenase (ABM) superfamily enzyme
MKLKGKFIAALKIWAVIYPSITIFLFLFSQHLSGLELYQRTFVLTIVLVPWMVFVGLPALEGLLRLKTSKGESQTR